MKREYLKPSMMAYDVDTTDIICVSPYDGPFGAKKGDEDGSDIDTELF